MFSRRSGLKAAVLLFALSPVLASHAGPAKPDLADIAVGAYSGGIVSDARGSSQSDVDVVVTKVGRNKIKVICDCDRIPERIFRLTRAMSTIQNVGGDEVFLLDISKSPKTLMLTIDDAAWGGEFASPASEPPDSPQ
jgi:hypothetical protein